MKFITGLFTSIDQNKKAFNSHLIINNEQKIIADCTLVKIIIDISELAKIQINLEIRYLSLLG